MSSSPAVGFTRRRRRQPLRRRLTFGLVLLVVVVLLAAGLAMTLAVRSFLVRQLDRELTATASGIAANAAFDPTGLRDGTVVVETDSSGRLRHAPVLIGRPGDGDQDQDDHSGSGSGASSPPSNDISSDDLATLSGGGDRPRTVDLPNLGTYRVLTVTEASGDSLTVGLPLGSVNETLGRLLLIEGLTLAAAAIVVAVGGGWLIRHDLLPLDRVAQTARDVAALPLKSGTPNLDERVPDAIPGTEIGDVAVALNEMLDHLDSSLEERAETERQLRQFVADASHELRTPLTSIKGYAELLRRPDADVAGRENAAGRIESEANRMGILVDDLLLLARLDQGRPLLHQPVDISLLAAEAASDISVSSADHKVTVDLPGVPVFAFGDEGRLRQVLANLLANAVQHTPVGSAVDVSVRALPDWVELRVSDNGPGISQQFQPHAFERFTRADGSRNRASGGSGLGLSIVAAVVQALSGTVELNSGPQGTSVTVQLPIASDPKT